MTLILTAIAPIALIILLGLVLRRRVFTDASQWALIDKLIYFVLFPSLLAYQLGSTDLSTLPVWRLTAALLGALAMIMAAAFALRPLFKVDWAGFSSVFQGSIRWNAYVALAVAASLYGDPGVALLAIAIIALIPVINVACVLVLSGTGHAGPPSPLKIARALATNPLILACAVGLVLNNQMWLWASPVGETMQVLGRSALPLGLLSVGAALDFSHFKGRAGLLLSTSALKLIGLPLAAALWCAWLGIDGLPRAIAIIACAVPATPNAYVLAKQMGGDAPLMAVLVTASVVLSLITMPLVIWLVI